jgi:hypothetical protein
MKYFFTIVISLFIQNVSSQVTSKLDTNALKSIDGIINLELSIISGELNKKRDWETFRLLFTPNAQFTYLRHDSTGLAQVYPISLEGFVRMGMNGYEKEVMLEYELKKTINEYNGIAQVFQSYYAESGELKEYGINSYQLVHDGERWWITSILWTDNSNGVELPINYK